MYLQATTELGIVFQDSANSGLGIHSFNFSGYSYASNYANDLVDRKSVSGYLYTLVEGAISWRSRKQTITTTTSTLRTSPTLVHVRKLCGFASYCRSFTSTSSDVQTVKIYGDCKPALSLTILTS